MKKFIILSALLVALCVIPAKAHARCNVSFSFLFDVASCVMGPRVYCPPPPVYVVPPAPAYVVPAVPCYPARGWVVPHYAPVPPCPYYYY